MINVPLRLPHRRRLRAEALRRSKLTVAVALVPSYLPAALAAVADDEG